MVEAVVEATHPCVPVWATVNATCPANGVPASARVKASAESPSSSNQPYYRMRATPCPKFLSQVILAALRIRSWTHVK